MKRQIELVGALLIVAISTSDAVAGPALGDEPLVEGAGILVGPGAVIHPSVGLETGFISNVFYEDEGVEAAGLLRLLAEVHIASLSGQRIAAESAEEGAETDQGEITFRGGARVQYDEFLSDNQAVQAQRDVAVSVNARVNVFPQGTWSFAAADDFDRVTRPTNFESESDTDRDVNHLRLFLKYQPGGRALSGTLRYENTIDVFETESQRFANRIQHVAGLRVAWNWLPITQFYGDVSIGYFDGLGDEEIKRRSTPLRALLGTSTALTINTTLNAYVGFGKGFYEAEDDFTNVIAGAELGWRYSPLGRMLVLYRHDFQDSINANYLRDHLFRFAIEQQVTVVSLVADVDLRLRGYRGLNENIMGNSDERNDTIVTAHLGASYFFRDWLAATLDYSFVSVDSDFTYTENGGTEMDDPGYVRHEIVAGARAAF